MNKPLKGTISRRGSMYLTDTKILTAYSETHKGSFTAKDNERESDLAQDWFSMELFTLLGITFVLMFNMDVYYRSCYQHPIL